MYTNKSNKADKKKNEKQETKSLVYVRFTACLPGFFLFDFYY